MRLSALLPLQWILAVVAEKCMIPSSNPAGTYEFTTQLEKKHGAKTKYFLFKKEMKNDDFNDLNLAGIADTTNSFERSREFCNSLNGKLPEPDHEDDLKEMRDQVARDFYLGIKWDSSKGKSVTMKSEKEVTTFLTTSPSVTTDKCAQATKPLAVDAKFTTCGNSGNFWLVCEFDCPAANYSTLGFDASIDIKVSKADANAECTDADKITCDVSLRTPKDVNEDVMTQLELDTSASEPDVFYEKDKTTTDKETRRQFPVKHGHHEYRCAFKVTVLNIHLYTQPKEEATTCQSSKAIDLSKKQKKQIGKNMETDSELGAQIEAIESKNADRSNVLVALNAAAIAFSVVSIGLLIGAVILSLLVKKKGIPTPPVAAKAPKGKKGKGKKAKAAKRASTTSVGSQEPRKASKVSGSKSKLSVSKSKVSVSKSKGSVDS